MHHRLASNPVRCDLVLYEDSEISHYSVVFFYSLICLFFVILSLSPKNIVCIGLCFIIALFI